MSQPVEHVANDHDASRSCWCCGEERPESALVHLGTHPEVAVCLDCADFLARRSGARRDELNPSVLGRVRDIPRAARRTVVAHGWQTGRVLGPALRWLGRHLP